MSTLINKAYYALRPLIPWGARTAARRWLASRRRISCAHEWPIDEGAGVAPPGWPGWPQGKRFAFVLTHDVEGPTGLARVERLMELERKYGVRSSFNFIPEGPYRVPDELRARVESAGFEVGVHGLIHDGKLFSNKAVFASRAARIREYVRLWNASGFRAPLMHHNLAWMHLVGSEYDASTFDTDPFEPEPDGFRTIFPFWVVAPNGGGYVELPYTLVQDFNLFTVLQERTVDIWKRKLDWVAERGGMALLNTHPDYLCFEGQPARNETPVALYEDFLSYATRKYAGVSWQALAREVSQYYLASIPAASRNSRRRICLLSPDGYAQDSRARQCAEALASRGDLVDVVTIADRGEQLGEEQVNGVSVWRIRRRSRGPGFHIGAARFLGRRHPRVRYEFIHILGGRPSLAFAAWYPKWTGVKLLLDLQDHNPRHSAGRIEEKAIAFADHVIRNQPNAPPLGEAPGQKKCPYLTLVDSLSTEDFKDHDFTGEHEDSNRHGEARVETPQD